MNDDQPMFRLMTLEDGTTGIRHGTYEELRRLPYTQMGRGWATEEELRREEHVITCHACGQEAGTNYTSGEHLRKTRVCFNCDFWLEKVRWQEQPDGEHQPVRVDGKHYCYDPRRPFTSGDSRYNGFGGHRWTIRFTDDGRQIVTNDLWHQGTIPEHFRARLPDNVVFL